MHRRGGWEVVGWNLSPMLVGSPLLLLSTFLDKCVMKIKLEDRLKRKGESHHIWYIWTMKVQWVYVTYFRSSNCGRRSHCHPKWRNGDCNIHLTLINSGKKKVSRMDVQSTRHSAIYIGTLWIFTIFSSSPRLTIIMLRLTLYFSTSSLLFWRLNGRNKMWKRHTRECWSSYVSILGTQQQQ